MSEKVLMVDLEDERTTSIADVISNETSKKILGVLADKEMSESDIATELNLPLNTVGYNVKKLEKAGLIKKSKNFFWSSRGKKISTYKIYNRKIVILPRRIIKGILPTVLITAGIAILIRVWRVVNAKPVFIQWGQDSVDVGSEILLEKAGEKAASGVASVGSDTASSVAVEAGRAAVETSGVVMTNTAQAFSAWAWFLLGAWIALVVFLLWSWWSEEKWKM